MLSGMILATFLTFIYCVVLVLIKGGWHLLVICAYRSDPSDSLKVKPALVVVYACFNDRVPIVRKYSWLAISNTFRPFNCFSSTLSKSPISSSDTIYFPLINDRSGLSLTRSVCVSLVAEGRRRERQAAIV